MLHELHNFFPFYSGFHFRFDKNKGSLIAPYWIEDTGNSWPVLDKKEGYNTQIILPLNQEAMNTFPKLRENMNYVFDKNLLLFLGKLSVMILEDFSSSTGQLTSLRRNKLSEHWLSLRYENISSGREESSTDFWFVSRRKFQPALPRSDDVDAYETEIAVALHFQEESEQSEEFEDFNSQHPASKIFTESEVCSSQEYLEPSEQFEDIDFQYPAGKNSVESKSRSLVLKASKELPVYSFLPTKIFAFRFIIQADFVLSTNRESIVEQSKFNQILFAELVKFITSIFNDLSLYLTHSTQPGLLDHGKIESESSNSLLPELQPLNEIRHVNSNFKIAPEAVISLLPRSGACKGHKEIQLLSQRVCENLKHCPLFLSSKKVICEAATIITVQPQHKLILEILPEDILFKFASKRYPHSSLELDDDLKLSFGIQPLNASLIVECIEALFSPVNEDLDRTYRINTLSRLLMSLDIITSREPPVVLGASSISSVLQKVDVTKIKPFSVDPRNPKRTAPNKSYRSKSRQLPADILKRLTRIEMWPISTTKFVSSGSVALFVPCDSNLPPIVMKCISTHLSSRINVIHEDMLHEVESIAKDCGQRFKDFILNNFKPIVDKFGLHPLSNSTLMSNFLKPELTNSSETPTVKISCALLACAFLCKDWRDLGPTLWVPTVKVRDFKLPNHRHTKINVSWGDDSEDTVFIKNYTDNDVDTDIDGVVHLGPEFENSASSKIFSTLLRQIGWKVVHPLVYKIILGIDERDDSTHSERIESYEEIRRKFEESRECKPLRQFLKKIGISNFFRAVHLTNTSGELVIPSLSAVLSKLLKNSISLSNFDQFPSTLFVLER